LIQPDFWFEDAWVFNDGRYSLLSFITPYSGYYHLIPRIIAYLTSSAAVYVWSCLLGSILILINMFSDRLKYSEFQKYCMVLSIAVVAKIPFLVAYFQWFLVVAAITLLLKTKPITAWQWVGDSLIVITTGLSSIFIIILLPFIFLYRRDLLFIAIVTAVIQATAVLFLPMGGYSADALRFVMTIPYRVIAEPLGITNYIWIANIIYIGLITMFLYFGRNIKEICLFVTIHFAFLLSALPRLSYKCFKPDVFNSGDRYYFIPILMLTWSLILIYPKFISLYKNIKIRSLYEINPNYSNTI
jgi:hypothetical protein